MKITKWDKQAAEDIGHAFGYYDYGQEQVWECSTAAKRQWQIT